MYHFIALVWNTSNSRAVALATHLSASLSQSAGSFRRTLDTNGMLVYSAQPPVGRVYRENLLSNDAGVVLGRLFSKTTADLACATEQTLDEDSTREIVSSGGRRLIDDYWGNYIAFVSAKDSNRHFVIRDCSGAMPCYRTRHGEVDIFFSDIADLVPLRLPKFTLNHGYLASFIYATEMQVRACAFNEVTEVLAGECVEVANDSVQQFALWDPRRLALSRERSFDEAILAVTDATQRCIDAWASVYDSILLSLSGGLDSAVVLGSLFNSPARPCITGLNQFAENTLDDERRYARLAATRARVHLVEQTWTQMEFDARQLNLSNAAKPSAVSLLRMLELDVINELADRTQAEALWTGQGGDHLFLAVRDNLGAADYVARHGIRPGLAAAIRDEARLSRQPYVSVARNAIKLGFSRKRWTTDELLNLKYHFVNRDALPDNVDDYITHPWTTDTESLPAGTQMQIALLADILNRQRPISRGERAYQHHPLLSQPLIELCLQIPTYLHTKGGRRRALAREAFRDRVPVEIIQREDKGNSTARFRELIRRSEAFLRDMLLDGVLVRERIISRRELEACLVDGDSYVAAQTWPLFACVSAELWARTSTDSVLRAAA